MEIHVWRTYNHSQNIWDKLYFLREIERYGIGSISIFQEIFGSTDKIWEEDKALGINSLKF